MTEELTEIVRLELAYAIAISGLFGHHAADALQQFLLTHASGRQTVLIECMGTQEEEGTDSDGNKTTTIVAGESLPVDVLGALFFAATYGAPMWVVADEESAKRGRYWRQIDYDPNPPPQTSSSLEAGSSPLLGRETTPLERKQGFEDAQHRKTLALPPWACISAQTPIRQAFVGASPATVFASREHRRLRDPRLL